MSTATAKPYRLTPSERVTIAVRLRCLRIGLAHSLHRHAIARALWTLDEGFSIAAAIARGVSHAHSLKEKVSSATAS